MAGAMPRVTEPVEPSLEFRIRMRAYDLYAERGKVDGHALNDWLQAEKEIETAIARQWATPFFTPAKRTS